MTSQKVWKKWLKKVTRRLGFEQLHERRAVVEWKLRDNSSGIPECLTMLGSMCSPTATHTDLCSVGVRCFDLSKFISLIVKISSDNVSNHSQIKLAYAVKALSVIMKSFVDSFPLDNSTAHSKLKLQLAERQSIKIDSCWLVFTLENVWDPHQEITSITRTCEVRKQGIFKMMIPKALPQRALVCYLKNFNYKQVD